MPCKRKFSSSQETEVVRLYEGGLAIAKIAEQLSVSNTAIRNILLRRQVKIRPRRSPLPKSAWTACACGSRAVYTKGLCRACYDKQRNKDPQVQDRRFEWKLRTIFKISRERYEYLLKSQDDVCAICRKPDPRGHRLAVDHSHDCCSGDRSCGFCVRGLLCVNCNTGIGSLGDNPENLKRAIEYLEKWRELSLAEQDAKLFFTEMADPRYVMTD